MYLLITTGYQQRERGEDFSLSSGNSPHQDKVGCGRGENCPVSQAFSADPTSSPFHSPLLQTISSTRAHFIDKIAQRQGCIRKHLLYRILGHWKLELETCSENDSSHIIHTLYSSICVSECTVNIAEVR